MAALYCLLAIRLLDWLILEIKGLEMSLSESQFPQISGKMFIVAFGESLGAYLPAPAQ